MAKSDILINEALILVNNLKNKKFIESKCLSDPNLTTSI